MAETFLALSASERNEALQQAAANSGRPANLLEKDVWVVWTLATLFESPLGEHLSFKGGTSLSKAYGVIDRFSEDIDLTFDVRYFIPELAGNTDGIPPSGSQGRKWTEAVRAKLPHWIDNELKPLLQHALAKDSIEYSQLRRSGERLYLDYSPLKTETGYVSPSVMLEFGARSTGEPAEIHEVTCDAAPHLGAISFPTAKPRVMKAERTFWEKATAAHVYCLQKDLKKERFSRHWHDLAALQKSKHFGPAVRDRALANMVVQHKSIFFKESSAENTPISYDDAVNGKLRIVPEGDAHSLLKSDYEQMIDAGLFHTTVDPFEKLMEACSSIQDEINKAATPGK